MNTLLAHRDDGGTDESLQGLLGPLEVGSRGDDCHDLRKRSLRLRHRLLDLQTLAHERQADRPGEEPKYQCLANVRCLN